MQSEHVDRAVILSQAILNRLYLLELFLTVTFLANPGWDAQVRRWFEVWQSSVFNFHVTFFRDRRQLVILLQPVVLIGVVLCVYWGCIRAWFALGV